MAVIATYTTRSGAVVRIHDDCMAPRGSEEEKRRIEAQRRAAYDILREMEAKHNGKHDSHRREETQGTY